jgi:cell division protein FtsL
MMGINTWNTILLLMVLFLVAGYFVGQVWKQDQYVALMKEQQQLNTDISKLYNNVVKLQIKQSQLKSFQRLEKIAKEKYGFVYSGVPTFVYPHGDSYEK